MKNSWENIAGAFWWICFLILLVAKTTGLIELGWIEVFLPLILPIIISVFVLCIGVLLCFLALLTILGTMFVMYILEKIKL